MFKPSLEDIVPVCAFKDDVSKLALSAPFLPRTSVALFKVTFALFTALYNFTEPEPSPVIATLYPSELPEILS